MLLALYSIFVFIFIGYIAKILRLLGNKQSGILLGFLINFALPAQIFNGTYHANINLSFVFICLIGFICNALCAFVLFCIAKFFKFDRGTMMAMILMGILGNTLFLGLPLVSGALGESYANQVVIYDQFVTSIPFAFLTPIFLSLSGKGRLSFKAIFARLFKSPLFLALLAGLAIRLIPYNIPDELFAPLKSLAQTATPVALFAIGVQMNLKSILNWKLTAILLSSKMLLSPFLLFCFVVCFGSYFNAITGLNGGFNDEWRMALIETSMPPQISIAAIIIKAGFNGELALNAITCGILLSFAIVPLWIYLSHII